ncbi:efflux RND transporter permease subunit [Gemmatimonas groenlandica]|uniref:Efflux RND transporter permease subunit n=1 Tax=Gemmatimonas groenlandica TaxID=2732249 RepID=A0A6M4IJP6_9BACT|nr:efflux RND transporter permease subunit [Gemmatimonas groenlandica]
MGNASFFGSLDFSMLLSPSPERTARLGITVDDVAAAVQKQNATKLGGRLGHDRRVA